MYSISLSFLEFDLIFHFTSILEIDSYISIYLCSWNIHIYYNASHSNLYSYNQKIHVLYFVLMPCSSSVFSCLSGIPWVSQAFFLPQTHGWAVSVILSTLFFSNSVAARVSQTNFSSKTRGWAVSVILSAPFFSNSDAARVSQTIFFSKTHAGLS